MAGLSEKITNGIEKIGDGITGGIRGAFVSAAHEKLSTHQLVVNMDMDNPNVPGESFAYIIDKDGQASVTSMDADVLNRYYGDNVVDLAEMNPSGIDYKQSTLASDIATVLAEHDPNALMIAGGDPEKPENTSIEIAFASKGALENVLRDLNFQGMDAEARGFDGAQEEALSQVAEVGGYLSKLDIVANLDGYAQTMTEDLNAGMGVDAGMTSEQQDAAVNYMDGATDTPKPELSVSP